MSRLQERLRSSSRSSHFLQLIAVFLVLAVAIPARAATAPVIKKVEPPNWWTDYVSPVMVLLTGGNLNGAEITTAYPGAHIDKLQIQPDGYHAFVWLSLDATAKPGNLEFLVKRGGQSTRVVMPLRERPGAIGRYQGLTRDDVIYLVMPDRFADGDPSNDRPQGAAAGTYDRAAARTYHGGDLKGIEQHLSYLKQLGVTTIWMTPVVENSDETSDYHGYGATDLYAVEDHYGSMADLQELVSAAHRLKMKVLLDMVPNHVGPLHPWAKLQPAPGWLHGTTEHHINTDYNYPPVADPHAAKANYESALDGWFANILPDLAQENPLVAQYLQQNALWWTENTGVDGFRIDTFPYVPRSFSSSYLQLLFATYPHFFTVGEVYNFDPIVTSYFAGGQTGFDGIDTHLTTPFDFPMNSAIREVINHGAPATKIVDVLRADRLFPHPELLVTFIGNHDMKRFLTDADGSIDKLKLAFSLQLTMRGIPQLYYGDEIAMTGGEDPDNRHDFPGGFPGDPRDAFSASGRSPQEQSVYAHVHELLRLREEHPALRTGLQKHVAVADKYYAFTRELPEERLLVVFYDGDTPQQLTLDLAGTSISGANKVTPLFGGAPVVKLEGTRLQLTMPSRTLAVYRVQ